jgi:hypothetical protein
VRLARDLYYKEYNQLKRTNMTHYADETPNQVQLTISTDLGFTADFLRELANAIENDENDEPFEDYETFRGVAKITWPEE